MYSVYSGKLIGPYFHGGMKSKRLVEASNLTETMGVTHTRYSLAAMKTYSTLTICIMLFLFYFRYRYEYRAGG